VKLTSSSSEDGGPIPTRHAFARAHPEQRSTFSGNVGRPLAWTHVPEERRSVALIRLDAEVLWEIEGRGPAESVLTGPCNQNLELA